MKSLGTPFSGLGYTLKSTWLLGWGQQREEIWCQGHTPRSQQVTQSWEAEVLLKVTISESPVFDICVRMGVLTSQRTTAQFMSLEPRAVAFTITRAESRFSPHPAPTLLLDMPAESCQKTSAFIPASQPPSPEFYPSLAPTPSTLSLSHPILFPNTSLLGPGGDNRGAQTPGSH